MPTIPVNGVELYYEETGDVSAPAILLIMGLATQLIAWPDDFVDGLAASGFRVICYDNRDTGLSSNLRGAPAISPVLAIIGKRLGLPVPLAYSLKDMAADAVGLMDALGVEAAHIVGVSMGGMIAQNVAALWPARVLSLTSIMSSSGAGGLPGPSAALRQRLLKRRPANADRQLAVAAGAELLEMISFPDPARAVDAFHAIAGRAYDRSYNPRGARRQLLAIIADGSRADRLATINAPTLVIHGAADPLVPAANGRDVAERVAGARLEIIADMAHDLPPTQMPRVLRLIADHADMAQRRQKAA